MIIMNNNKHIKRIEEKKLLILIFGSECGVNELTYPTVGHEPVGTAIENLRAGDSSVIIRLKWWLL